VAPSWIVRARGAALGDGAGRTVVQGIAIGACVGLVACLFYVLLQTAEHLFLDVLAGYEPLRPAGEPTVAHTTGAPHATRLWLLALIPALGGLCAGLVIEKIAPEVRGGGGDAYIDAFHRKGGHIRRRVAWAKMLATAFTLGSGGSAGREGPTMQVGAALASTLGRHLAVGARDQRMLVVAGTAAGLSAIFGTPLGAALLATEILYRDDFESDALIPAVLASVTAYSIFIFVFPSTGPLFAHAPRYPFSPLHLPLYAGFALLLCIVAHGFVATLHGAKRLFLRMSVPAWSRPAIGGLMLGVFAVGWMLTVNARIGMSGRGIGILGSGYGAAQAAIVGASWLPVGWVGVGLLGALAAAKILATSFTLGSGGSGGDFGPSLAIGALLGGAFGRAAQLCGANVDPGAFALVGMGTFYGGLAHAPVSSLVMVCELAGTYDLLVPLMLSEGLAFVVLRRVGLYKRQPASRFHSPLHAGEETLNVLKRLFVRSARIRRGDLASVKTRSRMRDIADAFLRAPEWQDTLLVVDDAGKLVGLVNGDVVRSHTRDGDLDGVVVAADVMVPPVTVVAGDDLHVALGRLSEAGVRELPVVDEAGAIIGLLDEADVTRAYQDYIERLRDGAQSSSVIIPLPRD